MPRDKTTTFTLLTLFLVPLAAAAADLGKARTLLMHGRYEEAAELYEPQSAADPLAALGLAACQEAQGKTTAAVKSLAPLAEKQPDVQAELARMAFERGDYDEAKNRADAALKLAPEHPLAQFIKAELARTSGRLEEAEHIYHRLIEFYNSRDVNNEVKKPDSLRWIGRADAQYARWNRLSDQFDFLVNELYPDAIKLDADYWPAHFEAGLLFMEKYNRADAAKEFQLALEINPRAAEVHAAVAELALVDFNLEAAEASLRRALEINPNLPAAWQMRVEVAWLSDKTEEALRLLRDKVLPMNPRDETTLARIAACYAILDAAGIPTRSASEEPSLANRVGMLAASGRLDDLVADVAKRNPHAGEFYSELADMLQLRNKHAAAEAYFREAIRVLPKQPEPRAGLGLLLMRMGREAEARKMLKEAFDADPFHVRVKNSLDVLDVVDAMQTRRTPHFIIKYGAADARLVPYLAPHLEKVYAELQEEFSYAPPEPTPVEVFSESQNQSGHLWFSARMVGLPNLETVAASTGRIVALVSPAETESHGNYAWARTIKHEMTHVFNLQQTGYNIPHWFTEGLAVYNEKIPRPYRWVLLLRRRAAAGTLMNLDNVNAGFARAMSGDECALAYCQSELYVEYMLALGIGDVLKNTVAAYSQTPSTALVIERVFGCSQAEFERGYSEFLRKKIAAVPVLVEPDTDHFDELQKAHRRQPKDADVAARLALAYLRRGANDDAINAAEEAAKLQPKRQIAAYVLARLHKTGTLQESIARLESCLDRKAPDPLALNLLASLTLKAKKYDDSVELFALGEKLDPANPQWTAGRVRVYLEAGRKRELLAALTHFAELDPNDLASREKLAALSLELGDPAAARRWATAALEIQVERAETHRLLAESLVKLKELDHAIEEFRVAIEIEPDKLPPRFALAEALVESNQPDKANEALRELLRRDPKYPGAAALLESVEKRHCTLP